MSSTTTVHVLDDRSAHGVHVSLLWYAETNQVTVEVVDDAAGATFELAVPNDRALDAFHHPYAYAAADGIAPTVRMGDRVEA